MADMINHLTMKIWQFFPNDSLVGNPVILLTIPERSELFLVISHGETLCSLVEGTVAN